MPNQMSLVGQLIGFVKMCRDLDMEIKQRISIREKRKEKLTLWLGRLMYNDANYTNIMIK